MRIELNEDKQKNVSKIDASTQAEHAVEKLIKGENENKSLCHSLRFLVNFNVPEKMLRRATQLAHINGTTGANELTAFGGMSENAYYRLLAKQLGVRFIEHDKIKTIAALSQQNAAYALPKHGVFKATVKGAPVKELHVPDPRLIGRFVKITQHTDAANRVAITSPGNLRRIIIEQTQAQMSRKAINHLSLHSPNWSSRFGARAWQGALSITILFMMVVSTLDPNSTIDLAMHIIMAVFFGACAVLRFIVFLQFKPQKQVPLEKTADSEKPIYSVMVALHDEADVIPDLVDALKKLQWPRSKLEIKLVCESDDYQTINAIKAQDLDHRFEIVAVPPSEPRTKPKALCYALSLTNGNYITLYDAEDRPHPQQLLEAYQKFRANDDRLACVQAPLKIANAKRTFWSLMFGFEYSALFHGLLPWLAKRKAPILLGGTSNHFNRQALLDVGAWDPFNVTEDADLGLRLWRLGYRTDVITRHTLEDAPLNYKTWLPQRTRWLKGWMQTLIVHSKNPKELFNNMSFSSFLVTQILLTGTIACALLHPFALFKTGQLLFLILIEHSNVQLQALFYIDIGILSLSYFGFIALCWRSNQLSQIAEFSWPILLTPLYWFFISIAAWRGIWKLIKEPFVWEKTPHAPHEK